MQYNEFASILLQSGTQAHIFHFQTLSHAEHKALNAYYDEIVELVDSLTESYQGTYGRVMDWTTKPLTNWEEGKSATYFKALYDFVQKNRQSICTDTWFQNQVDTIAQLISETEYLLTLK
jgi:hypothetical protein